jgi:cell division septal protein FtsQ
MQTMPTTKTKPPHKAGTQASRSDPGPLEPAWRQQRPSTSRRKKRQNQAVVEQGNIAKRGLLDGLHRPTINWRPIMRHWMFVPILALVTFGGFKLFTSDSFYVSGAQIRGNQRFSSEQIYAASQLEGQNIFWIRPAEIGDRVASLGGIASVSTHVRLPNQVVIDVRELAPLVAWQVGDQVSWIAEDGQAIAVSGPAPSLRLIDPDGAAAEPALPGEEATRQMRPKVLAALRALRGLNVDLSDLHYGAEEGLYLRAPQGWTVYLGVDGDMAGKIARLQAIQKQIATDPSKPKIVDLRLDGQAFYR